MAQKKLDLHEPLDTNAKPTLNKVNLTPDLAEASLTLHGDYYRHLQGKCNQHIFWHPASVATMAVVLSAYAAYAMSEYMLIADSVGEFFSLVGRNKFDLMGLFPCLIVCFAVIGLSGFFISDEFKSISDDLINPTYIEQVFGFDLRKYARLANNSSSSVSPKELKFLNNSSKNSQLIVYRDSPIAILSLKPLVENSTESNFFVKITGLNVRKVFQKVDFDTLLLENAIIRSREIFQDYITSKKIKNVEGCKINILIDAYSFDKKFLSTLKKNSFGLVKQSTDLNPFVKQDVSSKFMKLVTYNSLHRFFGIYKQTYGLTLLTKNEDQDLILKAAHNKSTGTKLGTADSSVSRKRK